MTSRLPVKLLVSTSAGKCERRVGADSLCCSGNNALTTSPRSPAHSTTAKSAQSSRSSFSPSSPFQLSKTVALDVVREAEHTSATATVGGDNDCDCCCEGNLVGDGVEGITWGELRHQLGQRRWYEVAQVRAREVAVAVKVLDVNLAAVRRLSK